MSHYIIIETDNGFMVTQVSEGKTAFDAAREQAAVVIDEGPFPTREEAEQTLLTMPNPYEVERDTRE
jgi:hypothetical protein